MPASQLPQWLFGFAGLIPDGFGSRVIRLSPKGQRACQVSPHINVVLLTPWADSAARRRGREEHWSGGVGGVGTLGWRETRIVPIFGKKEVLKKLFLVGFTVEANGRHLSLFGYCWSFRNKLTFDCRCSRLRRNFPCDDIIESQDTFKKSNFFFNTVLSIAHWQECMKC